jgi:hypothetical protein
MPVDAILIYGIRLYSSADGSTYSEYADMRAMGAPPAPMGPEVDVTPLADSEDARQFRIGLLTFNECDFEEFYTKVRMARVVSEFRTNRYWKIVIPDGATVGASSYMTFRGWIKEYSTPTASNADDPATIKFKVKVTGGLTWVSGS